MALKDPAKVVEMVVNCMQNQADEAGITKTEIDISGGIDSAVVAALACEAFGPKNVIGVYSSVNSSEESKRLAKLVADSCGCYFIELELSRVYTMILSEVRSGLSRAGIDLPDMNDQRTRTIFGSLRSCLRAPVGRFVNRCFGGGLRQGTGNRDEDELLRFYQKGGDGEVDCNWIAGLFKSEVWELAEYLKVPQEVINAKPTPDLWGVGNDHNDEDELSRIMGVPMTYTRPGGPMGTIEWASRENEKNGCITGKNDDIDDLSVLGYDEEQCKILEAVRHMEKVTRHKALTPPYLDRQTLINSGAIT